MRRLPLVGAAVAAAVIIAGVALVAFVPTGHAGDVTTPASSPTSSALASPTHAPGALPAHIDIPAINAHSTLISTGLNPDGTIEVPPLAHPEQASYYDLGPAPGEPGPAVVLGHVNADGTPGVFVDLHKLARGDEIVVTRVDGSPVRFAVDRVETIDKATFPTVEVYGDTPDPELRLITCGGQLDRQAHSYLSNVIVFAKEET